MNEVLNTEVISKQDSFCIRIQESFKNMNCSNDCEDISSILAEFEEYVKSDQQAEIERLTRELDDTISMNEMYVEKVRQNADLQKQVEKYKDEAITFKCEYEHQKDLLESKEEDYIVLDTLNTELQKQIDELKKRISKTYKVVTLCGSTRFKDTFIREQKRLTLEGNIVISVGLFGHSGDDEAFNTETKTMLDDMHKRKIDLSDEIFVINENGYIGTSTKSEIEYAKANGKVIKYLVEMK